MSEFNLSEKKILARTIWLSQDIDPKDQEVLFVEDVKEFIKKLKAKKMVGRDVIQISMREFVKLAGDDLI